MKALTVPGSLEARVRVDGEVDFDLQIGHVDDVAHGASMTLRSHGGDAWLTELDPIEYEYPVPSRRDGLWYLAWYPVQRPAR